VAVYIHRVYFFIFFLSLELPSKTMDNRPSQAFLHGLFLYRIPAPSLLLLSVDCAVASANGGHLPVPLSIFSLPYLPPQTTGKSPPNAFRLGRVSSPTPLPPPQLNFVWLLCILEWSYLGRAQTASALQRAESVHSCKSTLTWGGRSA